jgi:hypothetical protein
MQTISEKTVGRMCRVFQKCGSTSQLREIMVKMKNAIEITNGYQDSAGFHFGVVTAQKGPVAAGFKRL